MRTTTVNYQYRVRAETEYTVNPLMKFGTTLIAIEPKVRRKLDVGGQRRRAGQMRVCVRGCVRTKEHEGGVRINADRAVVIHLFVDIRCLALCSRPRLARVRHSGRFHVPLRVPLLLRPVQCEHT